MLFKSLNTYRNWSQKFMICLLMRRINSSHIWGIVTFTTKDDDNNAHLLDEISYAKENVFSTLLIESMYIPIICVYNIKELINLQELFHDTLSQGREAGET